jgi:drug/metabolite transporter (DMT)-like permease
VSESETIDEPRDADEPVVAAADAGAEAAEAAEHRRHARDVGIGTAMCLASAVFYTCTNACLRGVAHADIYLVSWVKALPTLAVAATILAADARAGRRRRLPPQLRLALFATGLFAHLGGNAAFQWGLGIVGLAAAVPLTFSVILIGGALLGRFWLGEGISTRSVGAMAVLCVAFLAVKQHTEQAATRASAGFEPHSPTTIALGVAAVCGSGIAYAVLGAVIRRSVTGAASMSSVLFVISMAGLVSLAPAAAARLGPAGLAAVTPRDWGVMLAAGTFNAVAFFALTRAMQLVPVSYVNIVNASQVAMAAAAGVLLFQEPTTAWLFAGVALTAIGLVLNRRPSRS